MTSIISKNFLKNHFVMDFVRFVSLGLINTLITVAIYQLLFFYFSYQVSYIVSWITGIIIVVALYPSYVFKKEGIKMLDRTFVSLFYLTVFVLSYLLLNYLVEYGIKKRFVIFGVVIFSAFLNFIGMRFILSQNTYKMILVIFRSLEAKSIKIEEYFKIDQKTLRQFFILFGIALLFYFSWLSSFVISMDGEFAYHRMSGNISYDGTANYHNAWITQGRWLVYCIEKFIFPQQIIPVLPYLTFCFFISISYLIVLRIHKLPLNRRTYLTFPIFCAFPTWDYIIEFTSNITSIGFGVFLISLSACFLQKSLNFTDLKTSGFRFRPNYLLITISAVLLSMAVGIYQVFIIMFVCLTLGVMTLNICIKQDIDYYVITKNLLHILCVCLLGIFMYFVISAVFLASTNESVQYIQDFWHPGMLFKDLSIVKQSLNMLLNCYLGSAKIYGVSIYGIGTITILGFISVFFSSTLDNSLSLVSCKLLLFKFISLLILMLLPFSLYFVLGGFMVPRLLIVLPYVVWLFAIIICRQVCFY